MTWNQVTQDLPNWDLQSLELTLRQEWGMHPHRHKAAIETLQTLIATLKALGPISTFFDHNGDEVRVPWFKDPTKMDAVLRANRQLQDICHGCILNWSEETRGLWRAKLEQKESLHSVDSQAFHEVQKEHEKAQTKARTERDQARARAANRYQYRGNYFPYRGNFQGQPTRYALPAPQPNFYPPPYPGSIPYAQRQTDGGPPDGRQRSPSPRGGYNRLPNGRGGRPGVGNPYGGS